MPDANPTFQIGQRYPTRGGGWAVVAYELCDGWFNAVHNGTTVQSHNEDGTAWCKDSRFDLLPPRPTREIRLTRRGTWGLWENRERVGTFRDKDRAEEWRDG